MILIQAKVNRNKLVLRGKQLSGGGLNERLLKKVLRWAG
ncbi:hypothetical protein KS4_34320 [Poriferisphaera corsica]|uniref:Uncharacterized protein n=1 Tax=Poriferisphaera corsica TaxID=2528020 RepID=A0A517YYQ3_9BACT|nr:hypothetical protein KS4_34320 [Poriferisphaera corsica]